MAVPAKKTAIAIAAIILLSAAIWFALKISSFSSLSESDAKWWVHASELTLIISALLLAFGLVGEWPDSESWKKRLLYKAAKLAVIIGVLGELVGDAGVFEADNRLQELDGKAISNANTKAAQAIERAGTLEKEAEQARLEQERLKQLVIWRSITDQQIETIAARLSEKKETILLEVVANDPEAMFFAGQLSIIFKDAHWDAIPRSVSWGNWLPLQLHIFGPDSETVSLLRDSFRAAGIAFLPDAPPRDPDASIIFRQNATPTATILVGSKVGPL